jgi:hypothetical protein
MSAVTRTKMKDRSRIKMGVSSILQTWWGTDADS